MTDTLSELQDLIYQVNDLQLRGELQQWVRRNIREINFEKLLPSKLEFERANVDLDKEMRYEASHLLSRSILEELTPKDTVTPIGTFRRWIVYFVKASK